MANLVEFLEATRHEMSQTDAEFIAERYRTDMVALSYEEKELMSRFLERHFYWLFGYRVSVADFAYVVFQGEMNCCLSTRT